MFVALARQDDKSKWGKGVAVIIKFYLGWRWRMVNLARGLLWYNQSSAISAQSKGGLM